MDELNEIYPGERGFFVPSIKHFCNKNSKSSRIPYFDDVIAHQHDYRLIDGWFHENLEITSAVVYQINRRI